MQTQPRIIRVSKAHLYLGMCREVFSKDIRPYLTEFRIGRIGKGFDRLELDKVAEAYMQTNIISRPVGDTPCPQDSTNQRIRRIGISKKSTEESELARVRALARGKKPRRS